MGDPILKSERFARPNDRSPLDRLDPRQELLEKTRKLQDYERKLKKISEDFNYNLQVIYDRDKEIESLNNKIDDLIALNKKKDIEIQLLKKNSSKITQLEQENYILTKKIEVMSSENYFQKPPTGRKYGTPKIDYVSMSSDRNSMHKSAMSEDKHFSGTKDSLLPLNQINSDLEKRIKSLELENNLNTSMIATDISTEHLDLQNIKEKVSNKEKEVSDLIKSLYRYKRDDSRGKFTSSYATYNESMSKDQDTPENNARSSSRGNIYSSYYSQITSRNEPMARCVSSLSSKKDFS